MIQYCMGKSVRLKFCADILYANSSKLTNQ
nr:MAG TPA: hypothetical protein [Caudoviricetes sp.]